MAHASLVQHMGVARGFFNMALLKCGNIDEFKNSPTKKDNCMRTDLIY